MNQFQTGLIELERFRVGGKVGEDARRYSGVECSGVPVTRDNGVDHCLENLPRGRIQAADDRGLRRGRVRLAPEQRGPQDAAQEGTPSGF